MMVKVPTSSTKTTKHLHSHFNCNTLSLLCSPNLTISVAFFKTVALDDKNISSCFVYINFFLENNHTA